MTLRDSFTWDAQNATAQYTRQTDASGLWWQTSCNQRRAYFSSLVWEIVISIKNKEMHQMWEDTVSVVFPSVMMHPQKGSFLLSLVICTASPARFLSLLLFDQSARNNFFNVSLITSPSNFRSRLSKSHLSTVSLARSCSSSPLRNSSESQRMRSHRARIPAKVSKENWCCSLPRSINWQR